MNNLEMSVKEIVPERKTITSNLILEKVRVCLLKR